MDTSPEYIKMCEKAKKDIKSAWRHGQPFFDTDVQRIEYACPLLMNVPRVADTILWEQDQLQEMIIDVFKAKHQVWVKENERLKNVASRCSIAVHPLGPAELAWALVYEIAIEEEDVWDETKPYYLKMSSSEQLWLAFVMKEKYGKVWDGEDWKEIKD